VKTGYAPIRRTPAPPEFFSTDVARARRFYLDLNPLKKRPLTVVCGGVEHCTPDYQVRRKTFPFYSIEYVLQGLGTLQIQDRTLPLRRGRLFSYGPGIPHRITGDAADPLVKYFVDFSGTHALGLMRACGLPLGGVTEVFPANALQPLMDEIVQAGLQGGRTNAALCAKLLECVALRAAAARSPLAGTETAAFTTYQHCRRYIELHCLRLRTLAQAASECHVTNAYLCRLFQRYDSQSPYQYLLRLKMNQAAEQLRQPGALVKQVAADSGYPDPFHFCRVFTSVFGRSPATFRGLR
jgi:AraC-like DNA-binding protein